MYILYLDESGVQEIGAGTSHFVLLGVAVRMDQWKTIDANIERHKLAFDLSGKEIHAAWMARRYSEQEAIQNFATLDRANRRKAAEQEIQRRAGVIGVRGNRDKIRNYRLETRKIAPYLHLTRDERKDCLRVLGTEISGWPQIRIFADAISKVDFGPGRYTPYEMAFEQVVSRFQTFLSKQGALGLIVSDNNATAAPRLTALSRKFHADGTLYHDIVNIIETPLFVNSELTTMIQIADVCSYALRRNIENGEGDLWNIVESRVDRVGDTMVGVRHYTGRRNCGCALCVAHGRRPVGAAPPAPAGGIA